MKSIARLRLSAAVVAGTAFAVGVSLADRGWKTPPEIGIDHMPQLCEQLDGAPDSKFRLPLSGAEDWPVYRVLWEEGELRVALDPDTHRVRALTTKDPMFRTPEGVHVGSTLKEARKKLAGEVRCGSGWTCFLELPSGWSAGFSTVYSNPATGKVEYRDPGDASLVNSLVLRGECEIGPE